MNTLQKATQTIMHSRLSDDDKMNYLVQLIAVSDNQSLLKFSLKQIAAHIRSNIVLEKATMSTQEADKINKIRDSLKKLSAH